MTQTVLITGSAGFIGYHTAHRYLSEGWRVIGLDAMTDYYDVALKDARQARLEAFPQFRAVHGRVEDPELLAQLLAEHRPDVVIHLAAQAGVRFSIEDPESYLRSNIDGTFRLLEAARHHPVGHLMIASTSSVYGANTDMPYRETDKADHPMSFYAATKKATEAMAHSYAHLYQIPVTMFRFFTVYGPWGRPDMALFKFTRAILEGRPIELYNQGDMRRDFTYVDDLVEGMVRLAAVVPEQGKAVEGDSLSPVAPFRVVNIGLGRSTPLEDFVAAIEEAAGRPAERTLLPMQPGDVPSTWADAGLLTRLVEDIPGTELRDGVRAFVDWYRGYNRL